MAKLDTLQTIEIAEGVEIRLRVAGPAVRGLALLIDAVIKIGILLAISIILSIFGVSLSLMDDQLGVGVREGMMRLAAFFMEWFYFTAFEASRWGATPGKRIMGLRVVQKSGAAVTLPQAVMRNLLRAADALPVLFLPLGIIMLPVMIYGMGFVSCLFTKRFQRLGDIVAGTVVAYVDPEHTPVRARPLKGQPVAEAPAITPLAPACPVTREEQEAIVNFSERLNDWSTARQAELAAHAEPLTHATGDRGIQKLLAMAQWIRTSR